MYKVSFTLAQVKNHHFCSWTLYVFGTHVLLGICTRSCWLSTKMLETWKLTLNFKWWWIVWNWISNFSQYLLKFLRSSTKILSLLKLLANLNDLPSWLARYSIFIVNCWDILKYSIPVFIIRRKKTHTGYMTEPLWRLYIVLSQEPGQM